MSPEPSPPLPDPSYEEWNDALIDYTLAGLRRGWPVYLSIDDDSLDVVWQRFLRRPAGERHSALAALLRAVRAFNVGGWPLRPRWFEGHFGNRRPRCVGILALMVLAAHRMADPAAAVRYFPYLWAVLRAPVACPNGAVAIRNGLGLARANNEYPDERFWLAWNEWLTGQGYSDTAENGTGAWAYVRYPISQTILRAIDRQNLAAVIQSRRAELAGLDSDGLAVELPGLASHTAGHLFNRLTCGAGEGADPRLFDAVAQDAYEVYRSVFAADVPGDATASELVMTAGLSRAADPLTGEVTYHAYPRAPRHWRPTPVWVRHPDGSDEELYPEPHRGGWYAPLAPPLTAPAGQRWQVVGDTDAPCRLELPDRTFWVLVTDPDLDYSDQLATWGPPEPGVPFLLLYRPQHQGQLDALRELGLLEMPAFAAHDFGGQEWRECDGARVVRPDWSGVNPRSGDRALVAALQPHAARVSVSLSGGLSVPGQNVWLDRHPPAVTVHNVGQWVWLRVVQGATVRVTPTRINSNQVFLPPWDLAVGDYRIEVWPTMATAAQPNFDQTPPVARRTFRLAGWDTLQPVKPDDDVRAAAGDRLALAGAWLHPECE